MSVRVSHKWVEQVFRQRGIPSPGWQSIERAIATSDDTMRQKLLDAMLTIEGATESPETLDWVRSLLTVTSTGIETKTVPTVPAAPLQVKSLTVRQTKLLAEQHDREKTKASKRPEVRRRKNHIYGAKAALTIELDTLRSTVEKAETVYSVLIEAAPAIATRQFDWDSKIQFQLMRRELPLVACCLLGMLQDPLVLKNHGPEANKGLHIENQTETVFVKLSQGPKLLAIPIQPSDVHAWLEILMEAMQLNSPGVGDNMQLALLRRVAEMVNGIKTHAKT